MLDITDLFNPNSKILCSADFSFIVNSNGPVKDRYIGIVFNMLEFPDKVIYSANQVCAAGQSYDDNPRKLGGKHRLVITDRR